jgi:ABC-type bacteriocin/lantibiotic exporter with double-glycine peptidase domain
MPDLTAGVQALWFPHHFLEGTEYLGNDGVFFQEELNDCGGASLKMILDHFGNPVDYRRLRRQLPIGPEGTTMLSIKRLAEAHGLLCAGWRLAIPDLLSAPLPAVLLLCRKHFVVLQSLQKAAIILDPVRGRLRVPARRLVSLWHGETLLFGLPKQLNGQHRWFPRDLGG